MIAAAFAAEPPPGRWYPDVYRSPAADPAELAQLEALGYVGASEPDDPGAGVTTWDRERAVEGVNLFSSGHASEAWLVAMDGRVLHRWHKDYADALPQLPSRDPVASGAWRRVALRPADGHLLAVWEGLGLVHLDARSEVVWATANRAHHDVRWLPDGGALALTRVLHAGGPAGKPVFEDFVARLDPDGRERSRVSVLDALARSPWADLLARTPPGTGDLLHTNALFPIPEAFPDPGGRVGPDRVLLSFRHLDALAVLDLGRGELTWAGTGPWSHQHDAELSGTGRLWLFDNRGAGDRSRVLAFAPDARTLLWSWSGPADRPLLSEVLGAVQELGNGNVLVTESVRGRALEVTRGGEVVWDYHNPNVRPSADGPLVAAIFELVRLPPGPYPWAAPGP